MCIYFSPHLAGSFKVNFKCLACAAVKSRGWVCGLAKTKVNLQARAWVHRVHLGIPTVVIDGVALSHPQRRILPEKRQEGNGRVHSTTKLKQQMRSVCAYAPTKQTRNNITSFFLWWNSISKACGAMRETEQSKFNFLHWSEKVWQLSNGGKWIMF